MAFNFNPLAFRTYLIETRDQRRGFVRDIGDALNQIVSVFSNPKGLAAYLNGSGALTPGSMSSAANTLIGNNTGATALDVGLTPAQVGAMFSGQNVLLATALANSLTDLGSPAGNSVVDTRQAAMIAVRLSWTTAANWTLTLNNLAQGAIVLLRLLNSSGAARTFTVSANTPAAVAYGVQIITSATTAVNIAGVGTTIANNGSISAIGITNTVGGSPLLQMIGFAA